MKQLRFYLMIFFCLLCLVPSLTYAQSSPQRIAILPVQYVVANDARNDVTALISDPIAKKFHHALNNFTKKYEYLTVEDISAELPDLSRYSKLNNNELIDLADRLNADLLLAPIVTRCIDQQYYSFFGEIMQETYVEIRLIGYERSQDHIIRLIDNAQYMGEYTALCSSGDLTREIMNNLIDELEDNVPSPLINK